MSNFKASLDLIEDRLNSAVQRERKLLEALPTLDALDGIANARPDVAGRFPEMTGRRAVQQ